MAHEGSSRPRGVRALAQARTRAADWHEAVREAQKVYPGTQAWLYSCSSSEGGWGRWVPNSQGSGVGGWLQFYPGRSGACGARHTPRLARGFRVPGSAIAGTHRSGRPWPAAWGVTHGRRGEWAGHGCCAYLQDPDVTLYYGDALETLRQLPDRSVHMCAT